MTEAVIEKTLKQEIVEVAKGKGLEITEDLVRDLIELVFDVLNIIVKKTDTPLDDAAVSFFEKDAKEFILKYIDKIDGKEG